MMPMIPRTAFTQQLWTAIFTLYRKINQSHWKVPSYDEVIVQLDNEGAYTFTGGKSSVLTIIQHDMEMEIHFVQTITDTASALQQQLQQMKHQFESELAELVKHAQGR